MLGMATGAYGPVYSPGSDARGRLLSDRSVVAHSSSSALGDVFVSALEKNFFINSALVVGEAPFIEAPFIMVIFSVLGLENINCALAACSSCGSGRELTATKPDGGEWTRDWPFTRVVVVPFPFASAHAPPGCV